MAIVKKLALERLIESFLFEKLNHTEYQVESLNALNLLTWNRFDLSFKLLYLELLKKNKKLAEKIYTYDIRSQTHGKFSEYGNDEKDSMEKYFFEFEHIFSSIQKNGFNIYESLVPLAMDTSIYNGAHRVASAIYLRKNVSCVFLNLNPHVANYQFFYNRNVPKKILDQVAVNFIKFADNIHLAFLWPSGIGHKDKVESMFYNIVYQKNIHFTPRGGYNILFELYKHMDWIGTSENGFVGIKQKLVECFPNFNQVKVIAFQADNLDDVQELKERVRKIYNIGYSSIHITDTKEEAVRISKLLFNDNSLHFLNYAVPNKYQGIYKKLDLFCNFLDKNSIDKNDVIIDGSLVLTMYGIRKNEDIDFLVAENENPLSQNSEFEPHDTELKYHAQDKTDLIYDPAFYFEFKGLKFISLHQLYKMKKNRAEEKDIIDCNLMDALLENNKLKEYVSRIQQNFFYWKIKIKRNTRQIIMETLRTLGLYSSIRWVYKKIKITLIGKK